MDPEKSMKEQVMWLAKQARKRLPNQSYPAKMYDFIRKDYESNPDKRHRVIYMTDGQNAFDPSRSARRIG